MKLKLLHPLTVKPDKNGEFSDALGRRLIAARLAEPVAGDNKAQGKKR